MEKKAYADETIRLRQIVEQLIEDRVQYERYNFQQINSGAIQSAQLQDQLVEQNEMLL